MPLTVPWRTVTADRPARWEVHGVASSGFLLRPLVEGGTIEIRYRFEPDAEGTRFDRAVSYEMPNAAARLVARLVLDRRIRREVGPALTNLKRIVEARAPASR